MSWAEDRRADRAQAREEARRDADAVVDRKLRERQARAELERGERRAREADRRRHRAERAEQRRRRSRALRGWASEHVVDLLIYPLAVASAVMAIPAMAAYGMAVYGSATGVVLPLLSELGMWAFATATMVSRRRTPNRSVWALQVGIGVFAGLGLGLNVAHGLSAGRSGIDAVVMGVVSVAGVTAHQLVVASPRRGRRDRAERRVERLADRRVDRARRLAVGQAVVELTETGHASLVHAPGRYVPRRGRLERATVSGLPVEPVDDVDAEFAALLEMDSQGWTTESDQGESGGGQSSDNGPGGVGVLDRPSGRSRWRPIHPQARRSLSPAQELRRAREIARKNGSPVSAEQIRKALQIAKPRARALRDQVNTELYGSAE